MRIRVDVGGLADLAGAVGVVERRLDTATADLLRALHAAPVAASSLALAAAARAEALAQLAALRSVVALVAESYAATEARVAQLVGSGPALQRLLGAGDGDQLEALLVSAPALAAAVTRQPGDDHRLADTLTRTLLLAPTAAARAQAQTLGLLDARQRRLFALLHPRLMTSPAGAPASDRFAASRVLVAADLSALLQRRAVSAPGAARDRLDRRISLRQRLLDEKVVLRHPDGSTTTRPHQLLSFDPTGDGRIVEVLGDVSRAEHLAVFVPGTGSSLDRYANGFGRIVPFAAADPSLAVVLWQNADHPDQPFDDPLPAPSELADVPATLQRYIREQVLAAAYRDAAAVAGPALAADVAGLRVALAGAASDLTVLGHSYGGSIVGAAEASGMVADRVVHVGSAGAFVADVADYAAPGAQRFSMTAYDDPIRLVQGHDAADASARLSAMLPAPMDPLAPIAAGVARRVVPASGAVGHGLDPDLLPGVVRLDTGVHDDGRLVRGHSSMFEPDSTAWRNLLGVMTKGEVSVLQPQLWSSHLETLGAAVTLPGGAVVGGTTMRPLPPRYVVDRSPYADPDYRAPVLDLG